MMNAFFPPVLMATSLVGVIVLGLGRTTGRDWTGVARIVAALSLGLGAALLLRPWRPWLTELFRWEAMAHAWVLLSFLGALPLAMLLRAESEVNFALLLGATLGASLLACANHLFVLFLGFEIMSLSTYLLVAGARREPAALEAAIKYFFSGAVAAGIFLFGLSIYYAAAGTMQLGPVPSAAPAASVGIVLMLCAALFKVGAVPFHFWLPDAYEAAEPELTGFMSTVVKSAGFLLLVRLGVLARANGGGFEDALPWISVATMTLGNLMALRQERLSRLLAYSSISHVGYLLAGVWAWLRLGAAPENVATIFLYLGVYLFMNTGAFLFLRLTGAREVSDLRGFSSRAPAMTGFFVLMLLSLAAIPPTGGFLAKFYVLWDVLRAQGTPLAVALALNSVIGIAYYFRVVKAMLLEEGTGGTEPLEIAPGGTSLAFACAVAVLAIGLFPGAKALLMGWFNG